MKYPKSFLVILLIWVFIFLWFFYYQNSNISFEYPENLSSSACSGWDIFLVKNNSKTRIFESRNSEIWKFAFCTPEIKKINSQTANIFLCFESGAGSWECSAILFEYNIKNNSWKFLSSWYYAPENYTVSSNIPEKSNQELLDYMKDKNYSVILN